MSGNHIGGRSGAANSALGPMAPIILAAALIMSAAIGIRQTFGIFIGPISAEQGVSLAMAAFAMATHNLVWGVAQPFAGAAADRWGAGPVAAFGAAALAGGLALAALVPGPVGLALGMGLLVGVGISCASFGVVLTAVGKAAPAEKRSMAMGLASAGGSFGQALLVPLAQTATDYWGVTAALLALAAVMLAAGCLGPLLDRGGSAVGAASSYDEASLTAVLKLAANHRGYRLLTAGFFVCGFQLAFIATHLPGYLTLCQMPAGLGAMALGLIGLFNMIGSWGCGWLGGRFPPQRALGWLYLVRGAAIAIFIMAPKSATTVAIFAAVMGLTWLGTVPLTSGLVARIFGVRHLGALFGVCFLSHQIGSFLGAWAGGAVFDQTGSYGPVWTATVVAGAAAAALHFAIDDEPADAIPTLRSAEA